MKVFKFNFYSFSGSVFPIYVLYRYLNIWTNILCNKITNFFPVSKYTKCLCVSCFQVIIPFGEIDEVYIFFHTLLWLCLFGVNVIWVFLLVASGLLLYFINSLFWFQIRRSQHAFINPAITIILRVGAGGHGVPPLGNPDG